MSEVVGLEAWIYSLLHADTGVGGVDTLLAGRIFTDEAPEGAAYPFALISAQSNPTDVVSLGPHRVMVNAVYWVRVVGQGASKKALQTAYDRIDSLLQAAGGTTADIRVLMVSREAQVATPPLTADGKRYSQLGGIYRAYVQAP